MRILYKKLLLTNNYQETSIKDYLDNLIDDITSFFPENLNLSVKKEIADFQLDLKYMIPVGIIVNELLANIIKHGFPGRDSGLIEIIVNENGENAVLTIQDNGIGLPAGFNIDTQKGFGLMLVKMYSEQLEGNFTLENDSGTKSTLEFPI